jgi:hypothetical protein
MCVDVAGAKRTSEGYPSWSSETCRELGKASGRKDGGEGDEVVNLALHCATESCGASEVSPPCESVEGGWRRGRKVQ